MNNTKIEWCDATFNPVTGCRHGCEYCYARRIAERFGAQEKDKSFYGRHPYITKDRVTLHELDEPATTLDKFGEDIHGFVTPEYKKVPYPFGFEPTLHRYKLNEPQHWRKPRTVFVCSMADLFGEWVPDEWIEAVFEACERAPQHRYIFLTKNPGRYRELAEAGKLPELERYWYGTTITDGEPEAVPNWGYYNTYNMFLNIEPLLGPVDVWDGQNTLNRRFRVHKLFILGAETGNRKGKVTPRKEWIDAICEAADRMHTPVFMKDSLIPIVGEANMRRELPWRG